MQLFTSNCTQFHCASVNSGKRLFLLTGMMQACKLADCSCAAVTFGLLALQAGADGSFMSLVMHHIIMDGMSLDIMMSDLLAAYSSFQLKQIPQLPALPVQYIDFTHWQQEQLIAEVWKPEVGYLLYSVVVLDDGQGMLINSLPFLFSGPPLSLANWVSKSQAQKM